MTVVNSVEDSILVSFSTQNDKVCQRRFADKHILLIFFPRNTRFTRPLIAELPACQFVKAVVSSFLSYLRLVSCRQGACQPKTNLSETVQASSSQESGFRPSCTLFACLTLEAPNGSILHVAFSL